MLLSRKEFEQACGALIAKYQIPCARRQDLSGWSWEEYPSIPGFGYMFRTTTHTWKAGSITSDAEPDASDYSVGMEEEDASTVDHSPDRELLTCQQYVVYSATFQVPAFYFSIHGSNGSPLTLSDVVCTTLFHSYSFSGTNATAFGLTRPHSAFPLLSQGEHPTLGTPCWYLHPCESANSVEELLCASEETQATALQRFIRWMELWFMVVGTAVNVDNTKL